MRLYFYAVKTKTHTRLSTRVGSTNHGVVESTHSAWGVGKRQWKRAARKLHPDVKVRTLWLGPWARYWLYFEGTAHDANLVYQGVR